MKRTSIVPGTMLLLLGAGAPGQAQSLSAIHESRTGLLDQTRSEVAVRDPVATAVAEYEKTGNAPVIQEKGVILHPFGHGTPKLSCAPLQACRIELQSGEAILSDPALGDTERWMTVQIVTGPGGATPVLVVKPTDCGVATNIMISTDRRIYDLDLEAGDCRRGSAQEAAYTRAVGFYYPDDAIALAAAPEPAAAPTIEEMVARARNTNYRWKRKNGFPWEPARVADDGVRTYIELPPEALHGVAPVLYLVDDEGEFSILNYTPQDNIYLTDRVLDHAALVIGEGNGDQERALHIERYTDPPRSSFRRAVPILGGAAFVGVLAALLIGG